MDGCALIANSSSNCSRVLIAVRSFLKRWVKDMPEGVEADKLTVWMGA